VGGDHTDPDILGDAMKTLTMGQNGNVIVEMNPDEMKEFEKLIASVEGKTINDHVFDFNFINDARYAHIDIDLSSVFGAVQAFYEAKFRVNEIQKGLDLLKSSLENKKR
jgi:hypothetical protein